MARLHERNALPAVGPRFFRAEDGTVMFEFVIDAGNVIGPREATKADSEKHPLAWSEFVAPEPEPEPEPERHVPLSPTVEPVMQQAYARLEAERATEPEPVKAKRPYRRKAA